ncbi:MAG TPA: hypothetical protein VHV52_01605 [Gaiellaceae bacterium]|nr:hypothetical protein [Gaiellaceae bacterium]
MEIWLPAAFLVIAVLGSAAYAAVRGWRLWRTFRATARRAGDAIERVTTTAAKAEEHALSLTGNVERLTRAADHLQESLAELAVIRAAAAEARAPIDAVRGIVPTK